jgi:hypothetical protein
VSLRQPSPREVEIGRFTRTAFGGTSAVHRYADDDGVHELFLVSAIDSPEAGVTSFGTVGLSAFPIRYGDQDVNVEVLGACASSVEPFSNVISSCAIERMKDGTSIHYGSWIESILDPYAISPTLRHVTFVAPFLWEGFTPHAFDGVEIHWLLAVPISDGELNLLRDHGIDALETAFEQHQIDLFDISRASVV